jgi:SRSO17 transposase
MATTKMQPEAHSSEARFSEYVHSLAAVMGRGDRAQPLKDYCIGLLMPGERKSVEPMAAVVAPSRVSAKHQSLLHLVGQAAWSDQAVLDKVRELVLPAITAQGGGVEAWIVDDTGFAKKGVHSVGVARQYCGRLGKTDNCQIAVTLSIANHAASLPIAYRLYLPEDWAKDTARREKAHVPDEVVFETKPQIALAQIKAALSAGVAPGIVLADAGYGVDGAFRSGLTTMGLAYVVGVQSTLGVWPLDMEPLPPEPWSGRGRKPSRLRRNADHAPVCAKTLAKELPAAQWRTVAWREGSNEALSSRFAAVRLRPASRDWKRSTPHPLEWLLVEWPEGEDEPTKYWLSTLPEDVSIEALVDRAKLRWRIERDYEELKSELGLAHFEGRGWRGFHHHATLCIAAYGFLIRERAAIPPSGSWRRETHRLSDRPKPRGAADPARAPCEKLDRDNQATADGRAGPNSHAMPVLPHYSSDETLSRIIMTQ